MDDWRVIRNASTGDIVLARAKWCKNFWCRFCGLQFRRGLPEDEGLLFVFKRQGITETSIHMFFVFFSIAAVWINEDGVVVDAKLAKPWRPAYLPAEPARYLIEARPSLLERVAVGDRLVFDEQVSTPGV